MPCSSANQPAHQSSVPWTNWIGDVSVVPSRLWQPSNLRELVRIASDAIVGAQPEVRAVGSGYSFENIAATNHWMIDTSLLNKKLHGVVDAGASGPLTPYWQNQQASGSRKLVHNEAGIRLHELCLELEGDGLSLLTAGGTLGQTLAGAVSTSTHGSNPGVGPLCDQVQAMHIVSQGGHEWWIERASSPVTTNDARLRDAVGGCHDLRIIRSDDLFNAAVVSAGRFGVVYSMVFEVRLSLSVVEYGVPMDTRRVVDHIDEGEGMARLLPNPSGSVATGITDLDDFRYFDFIMNSRTPHECIVRRRWETTAPERGLNGPDSMCEPGVVQLIASLAGTALGATPVALAIAATAILDPFVQLASAIAAAFTAPHIVAGGRLIELSQDSELTLGRLVEEGLNYAWDIAGDAVTPAIDVLSKSLFDRELAESVGLGKRGAMWKVAAGEADPAPHARCYLGNSIEIFFDYRDPALKTFLRWLIDEAPKHRQAGWIAVRFSKQSPAFLSMHHAPGPTKICAIEVTSLKGLAGNDEWFRLLEARAIAAGARLHWGQQNNLTQSQVAAAYPETLDRWRRQCARVVGTGTSFSNAYTRQRGLEPDPAGITDEAHVSRPGSVEWREAGTAHAVIDMTGEGRDLWCVTSNKGLFTKRPDSEPKWTHAGSINSPAVAMAVHNGQLFLTTQEGALWKRAAVRGHQRWTLMGVANGATTLAAARGMLFGTTPGNRLISRPISGGDWRDIGSAHHVISMDASASNLYCVTTNGKMYWRPAVTSAVVWKGFDRASHVAGIAALDQVTNLFLATKDNRVWARSTVSSGTTSPVDLSTPLGNNLRLGRLSRT